MTSPAQPSASVVLEILGRHASIEGMIDLLVDAYFDKVPPEIRKPLMRGRSGEMTTDFVRAVVAREGWHDVGLRDDLRHANQVRNDLAHARGHALLDGRWELSIPSRQRKLQILPQILTPADLEKELSTMVNLDGRVTDLLIELGAILFIDRDGTERSGPGPKPYYP